MSPIFFLSLKWSVRFLSVPLPSFLSYRASTGLCLKIFLYPPSRVKNLNIVSFSITSKPLQLFEWGSHEHWPCVHNDHISMFSWKKLLTFFFVFWILSTSYSILSLAAYCYLNISYSTVMFERGSWWELNLKLNRNKLRRPVELLPRNGQIHYSQE